MAIGYQSDRVQLVPIDRERHFENCYQWINDPEINQNLLVGDTPITRLAQQDWFEKNSQGDPKNVVFAIELLDGTHIGQSGVHNINYRHQTATTGSFLAPQYQNQGYGTEAVKLRSWYCFHILGLRLLKSEYFEGNERSQKMQDKSGYVEVGRIPDLWWMHGRYIDEIITVLHRDRWQELSQGQKNW